MGWEFGDGGWLLTVRVFEPQTFIIQEQNCCAIPNPLPTTLPYWHRATAGRLYILYGFRTYHQRELYGGSCTHHQREQYGGPRTYHQGELYRGICTCHQREVLKMYKPQEEQAGRLLQQAQRSNLVLLVLLALQFWVLRSSKRFYSALCLFAVVFFSLIFRILWFWFQM